MLSIKDFLVLTKFNLIFAVMLSAIFTFILAKGAITIDIVMPSIGILLLGLGVSALNEYQEHEDDAKMTRTKDRPIPSQKISPKQGLMISISLIIVSFIIIWFSLGFIGLSIFAFIVILYNGIYTRTKKHTVYAVVYGAVLGVIPPLIGWIVADGNITDIRFLAIALFYFVWQIPHFWLLILKYHEQYEAAGYKTVATTFGVKRLERITFIWLLLALMCGLFTIIAFPIDSIVIAVLMVLLFAYSFYSVLLLPKTHNYIRVFIAINLYITLLMVLLDVDILISSYS